jgi:hypothetical protein
MLEDKEEKANGLIEEIFMKGIRKQEVLGRTYCLLSLIRH